MRYTAWSPIYDLVTRPLRGARERAHEIAAIRECEHVLIVGVGTGEDLPFVPAGATVLGTDITPAMLERAKVKAGPSQTLHLMDGQALDLPSASFDVVLLHLILAVIPDPVRCLSEAARVLRPGGRVVVFDKFVGPSGASWARRLLNVPLRLLATDINRSFPAILHASGAALRVEREEPVGFASAYRVILLRQE